MVRTVIFSGREVVRILSFSVRMEVLWIILLVFDFAPVVSFIIDVEICVKELVFKSDSLKIFVNPFISVEGKTFSLLEIDCVELSEVTIVVSLSKEVVSIIGLFVGISIKVVSIL